MVPRPIMEKDLKKQEKELTDDINNLNKKVSWARILVAAELRLDIRYSQSTWKSSSTTRKVN